MTHPIPYLGETLALSSAVVWAVSVILFRISGFNVSPLSLNLIKGVIGSICLTSTLLVFGTLFPPNFRWDHFLWMALNGVIGIALADTLFFKSLNLLGAARSAIVDCLYSPFIIVFAYFILEETLTPLASVGALLIASGVLLTSVETAEKEISPSDFWKGVAFGVASMALMAVAIVVVKPILSQYPILWSAAVRMAGGTAALILFSLLRSDRGKIWKIFKPQPVWKFVLPSTFLGGYFAFILWMGGFKFAQANIAGLFTQLSSLFVVILAVLVLKERLTKWKVAALILALTGSVLIW